MSVNIWKFADQASFQIYG